LSLPVNKLKTNAKQLDLGDSRVFHLPNWNNLSHPERLAVMRQIAMMRGRDPRIAKLAVSIIKKSGAKPREYEKQAASLLKWVQDPRNVYYVNEPGERLQDPLHTIKIGHGDCDDQSLLLTCLFESIGLPWKYVLSGRSGVGKKVRHIEGGKVEPDTRWSHIYCMVGTPPFSPNRWYFCETTVIGVPLGWDVIEGDHSYLPEMAKTKGGPAQIMIPRPANSRFRAAALPPADQRSPAYMEAMAGLAGAYDVDPYGLEVGAQLSTATKQEIEKEVAKDTKSALRTAILTGVAVSVCTSIIMQYINGEGFWKGSGHFIDRWSQRASDLATQSRLFPTYHLSAVTNPKGSR
jgi:hypothetical protein